MFSTALSLRVEILAISWYSGVWWTTRNFWTLAMLL